MANLIVSTIRFPKKIENWLQGRINETGLSKNAIVILAMEEYIQQKEVITTMKDMTELYEKMENIEKAIEEVKEK